MLHLAICCDCFCLIASVLSANLSSGQDHCPSSGRPTACPWPILCGCWKSCVFGFLDFCIRFPNPSTNCDNTNTPNTTVILLMQYKTYYTCQLLSLSTSVFDDMAIVVTLLFQMFLTSPSVTSIFSRATNHFCQQHIDKLTQQLNPFVRKMMIHVLEHAVPVKTDPAVHCSHRTCT